MRLAAALRIGGVMRLAAPPSAAVMTARSFVDNSNIAVRGYDDRVLGRRAGGGRGVVNAASATYHRAGHRTAAS